MRGLLAFVTGVSCLVALEAKAQCATSCSTVTPKQPVILVHGRNDDAARWDTSVDPDSSACFVSKVQHLVVPRDTHAIGFAYCEVNRD